MAGSLPTRPASEARSVPCPLPVALRLPNRCTLRPVALRQLVGRQLRAALVEVVGDAHRPDGVRTRGARADLVELVQPRSSPGPWTSSRRRGRATGWRPAWAAAASLAACWARASGVQVVPVITAAAPMTALRMRNDRRSMFNGSNGVSGNDRSRSSSRLDPFILSSRFVLISGGGYLFRFLSCHMVPCHSTLRLICIKLLAPEFAVYVVARS